MIKAMRTTRLVADLRKFAADIIAWFIPVHMKRITFLITLYHYMMDDLTNEHTSDLEALNRALKLAKTDAKSLILPGLFTRSLWRGCGSELLHVPDDELLTRVKAKTPCWLRYGRDEDVRHDLIKLRNFILEPK